MRCAMNRVASTPLETGPRVYVTTQRELAQQGVRQRAHPQLNTKSVPCLYAAPPRSLLHLLRGRVVLVLHLLRLLRGCGGLRGGVLLLSGDDTGEDGLDVLAWVGLGLGLGLGLRLGVGLGLGLVVGIRSRGRGRGRGRVWGSAP